MTSPHQLVCRRRSRRCSCTGTWTSSRRLLRTWTNGLHPFEPTIRDGKLYARGAVDDGYAIYAALAPIAIMQQRGLAHPRVVVTLEASEESGSFDFEHYISMLRPKIGAAVDTCFILDSDALEYDTLYLAASLRGCIGGVLSVRVSSEDFHSGSAGGIIPDTFRIARHLVDRVEDAATGDIKVPEFYAAPPEQTLQKLKDLNAEPYKLYEPFPFLPGVKTECQPNNYDTVMRNCWMPVLTVTGASGLPPASMAGNVLRTETQLKLSVRLPPCSGQRQGLCPAERDP